MAVIIDALAGRDGVSDAARRELSTRIRKLRIKGFRAANRTPHDRLVETVLDAIADGDHGLAAAIVATWMQTRSALRERAAEHPAGTRHRRGRCAARSVHQLLGHRRVAARTQPDASGPRRRPCAPRRCRADAEPGVRPAFPVPRRSNPSSSRPGSTRCGSCPRQRPNGPPTRPTWASGSATSCKRRNASSSKASSTRSPASGTGVADTLQAWAREPGGSRRGGAGLGHPPLAGGAAAAGDRPAGSAACRPLAGWAR